jgi:purine nucleosidase
MATAPRKVLIDTDTGIDDAMAVVYALNEPRLEVVGLTSVFGNVSVELTTANTLQILELLDRRDIPCAAGAACGLTGDPPNFAPYVHGDDGVGNAAARFPPPTLEPTGESAAELIVRLAREHAGELYLAPIGPLTNVALALALEPKLTTLVKGVVWMGGVVQGPGNVTPVAEADAVHDPEAAQAVLAADWPVTLVGLDVTDVTLLTEADFVRIERSDTVSARYLAEITPFYMDFYSNVLGFRACATHSALTVALIAHPQLVCKEIEVPVAVELHGSLTRGMTVADRRGGGDRGARQMLVGHRVRIPLEVDSRGFIELFVEAVTTRRS